MAEAPNAPVNSGLLARLARTRAATRTAIILERAWPLLLPLLLIAALFVSAAWFGLFRLLPDTPRLCLAAAFALAALAALLPLGRFRMPDAEEVDRRIERANRLEHTPLLVQADRPAGGDAFAGALWQEHQKRMAARLDAVSGDLPRPRVPERDPWGLRAAVVLVLAVAFAFSWSPLAGRIGDAFSIHIARDTVPPRIDAWVTPPAYTGVAPIFLTADNAADATFTVPTESQLTLRVTGGNGAETLDFTGSDRNVRTIDPAAPGSKPAAAEAGVRQFTSTLTRDGVLSLKSNGGELRHWAFSVTPDRPPVIHFAGDPKQAANGTLELAYTIEDDYGAASAKAEFEQAETPAPGAHPLYPAPDLPLVLPRRDARDHRARTTKDLTEHPWAGSRVRLTLTARDDAGHEARSETRTMVLPERPFANPLARALVEQRRILALDANQKGRVLDLMDAVTLRPEDTFTNMAHYLAIMSARTRLDLARTDDQYRDVVAYLWQIALAIENGGLSDAEKRLRQAEQALKQALERGASDQEIDKLMKELRQAMQDYLREFAEQAKKNPNLAQQLPQNGQEIRKNDLDRMLDQIENLAKSGSRDKAQQLLSQLQDMMNNLQASRGQQQGDSQQNEMRRKMDKLGEIMRKQQEMMNKTFRLDQQQQRQNGSGDAQDDTGQFGQQGEQGEGGRMPNGQKGQGGMTDDQLSQALRGMQKGQEGLRGDLGNLMKDLKDLGIKPGQGFGDAGEAMGRAGKALGQAEGGQAVEEQGQALEALRRGAKDMMQQMQQAMRGDKGGSQQGGQMGQAGRDPLGRPRATDGPDFGDSVKVPDEIDIQRARQILEAIRKRLGNALSPELERSYLERLLQMK